MEEQQQSTPSGNNIALVKLSDMPDEMRTDSVETVSTAIETALEKHPQNYEVIRNITDRSKP
jgi:cephalosporin hydroxylase